MSMKTRVTQTKKKAKQYFNIVRNKLGVAPHDRKGSMDLENLGAAVKVSATMHVEVDPNSTTGFKGLPNEWENLLYTRCVRERN